MSACATSASGAEAPIPVIQSASAVAMSAIRSGLFPLITKVFTGGVAATSGTLISGACSRTM